jgi:hypothetical protein
MARGNARERIYWDDEDRQRFLDGLSREKSRVRSCFATCAGVMSAHVSPSTH